MTHLKDQIKSAEAYGLVFVVGDMSGHAAEFLKRDYDGDVESVDGRGASSLVLSQSFFDGDFFRPVMGGSLRIDLRVKHYLKYLKQWAVMDETEWLVKLYRDYDTISQKMIFWGYPDKRSFTQDWHRNQSDVTLTVTDGLAILKDVTFEPLPLGDGYLEGEKGPLFGEHPLREVLAYLFSLGGNRTVWRSFVPYEWEGFDRSTINFMELPVCVADYYGQKCSDVLEELMKIAMTQVVMHDGYLMVRMPDVMADGTTQLYSHKGEVIGSSSVTHDIKNIGDDIEIFSGSVSLGDTYKLFRVKHEAEVHSNILPNGGFEVKELDWGQETKGGWYSPDGANFSIPRGGGRLSMIVSGTQGTVQYDMDRGSYASNHLSHSYWKVIFELMIAKPQPPLIAKNRLPVKLGTALREVEFEWPEDNQYTTVEALFTMTGAGTLPHTIGFVCPASSLNYPPGMHIGIRNVRVVPWRRLTRNNPYGPPGTVYDSNYPAPSMEREYEIKEHSMREAEEVITKVTGMNYIYKNSVHAYRLRHKDIIDDQTVEEHLTQRWRSYYSHPRMTIRGRVRPREGTLQAADIIQDAALNRTFIISSFQKQIRENIYNVELVELYPHLLDNPEGLPWILETGAWNDEGVWIDSALWTDN